MITGKGKSISERTSLVREMVGRVNGGTRAEPRSARIPLARIAERVIARNTAVTPTAGLGRWVTVDEAESIIGVVAAESVDGMVDLGLYLRLLWPPPPLGTLTRILYADLRREAERAGLGERLGEVEVHHVNDLLQRLRAVSWPGEDAGLESTSRDRHDDQGRPGTRPERRGDV